MHPAIIIGIVRSLIVDVAMGQIPRSTERISSLMLTPVLSVTCGTAWMTIDCRPMLCCHGNVRIFLKSKMTIRSNYVVHFLANVNSCSCSPSHRPSVCRLSVCRLFVTFVYPTQPIEIFGNVSMPFNTLVTWRHPFYGDRPRETPPSGG